MESASFRYHDAMNSDIVMVTRVACSISSDEFIVKL
jgi:hypothetical protein